jgi:hypothetical protein
MAFLAGGVALEKFPGHRRALGDGEDLRIAVNLAGYVCGDEEEIGAYFAWLRARTELLLNQPWSWRAVADLAHALLEHKELSGRVARRIYQAAIDTYGQDDAERAAMDAAVGWGTCKGQPARSDGEKRHVGGAGGVGQREQSARNATGNRHTVSRPGRSSKPACSRPDLAPGGGYRLARPAEEITLLEIVEAVDGPAARGDTTGRPRGCHSGPTAAWCVPVPPRCRPEKRTCCTAAAEAHWPVPAGHHGFSPQPRPGCRARQEMVRIDWRQRHGSLPTSAGREKRLIEERREKRSPSPRREGGPGLGLVAPARGGTIAARSATAGCPRRAANPTAPASPSLLALARCTCRRAQRQRSGSRPGRVTCWPLGNSGPTTPADRGAARSPEKVSAKSHRTGAGAIPPRECWQPMQSIRRWHDRPVDR